MLRETAVKVTAGSIVVGALSFGLVLPAQAASEVQPEPSTSSTAVAVEEVAPSEAAPEATVTTEAPSVAPAAPQASAQIAKPSTKKRTTPTEVTVEDLDGGATVKQGATGPGVAEIQRRLNVLGILVPVTGSYTSATASGVARFNEKFRWYEANENKVVNLKTWALLKKMSNKGDKVPAICKKQKAALCISKEHKVVRYYRNGKLVESLDARFGGAGYRTREGNFRIFRKVKDDFSSLYKTPMPWSMYFSGGQAVHYSMFFNGVGYNGASHGCVNIRDKKKLIPLWRKVKIGTFAKVY